MIIRSVIHVMPWEIDHLFLLQHQLKRSSYYLKEDDRFEMDVVLNLSDKLIDWDNSKLPHDGSRILTTNGLIHNEMVNTLTQKKYKIYF